MWNDFCITMDLNMSKLKAWSNAMLDIFNINHKLEMTLFIEIKHEK